MDSSEYKTIRIEGDDSMSLTETLVINGFNLARPIHITHDLFGDGREFSQAIIDLAVVEGSDD